MTKQNAIVQPDTEPGGTALGTRVWQPGLESSCRTLKKRLPSLSLILLLYKVGVLTVPGTHKHYHINGSGEAARRRSLPSPGGCKTTSRITQCENSITYAMKTECWTQRLGESNKVQCRGSRCTFPAHPFPVPMTAVLMWTCLWLCSLGTFSWEL